MNALSNLSIWEQIDYIKKARSRSFFEQYWTEIVLVLEKNSEAQNETMYSGIPTDKLPELLTSPVPHVQWFASQEVEKRKPKTKTKSTTREAWKELFGESKVIHLT